MPLKLGAYTACLHDHSLREALIVLAGLGLTSAEINAGGFLPAPHMPVDALLASPTARREYLAVFDDVGVELTGLNVNGNPLHPDPEVRRKHSDDLRKAIEIGRLLGVRRVVTMSGLPAASAGGTLPSWNVNPWDSAYHESLAYQWDDVVIPFWTEIAEQAALADVKVCIEMHPHNVVFNPPTLERLVERTGATHVGAEMDPSHLFWQGMDPVACIERLGPLVFHAAAKDIRVNPECLTQGVLDDRFTVPSPGSSVVGLGGRYVLADWPKQSSWQFVAVGRGHDEAYWTRFLAALAAIDPDMAVNIEHEDFELPQLEGLTAAAETLHQALRAVTSP